MNKKQRIARINKLLDEFYNISTEDWVYNTKDFSLILKAKQGKIFKSMVEGIMYMATVNELELFYDDLQDVLGYMETMKIYYTAKPNSEEEKEKQNQ